jgi:hypothetical protein
LGYVDDTISKKNMKHYGYEVLGTPEEIAEKYVGNQIWYYCAIGINKERERNSIRLEKLGWKAGSDRHLYDGEAGSSDGYGIIRSIS